MNLKLIKTIRSLLSLAIVVSALSCQKNMNDNSANLKPSPGSDIAPKEFKNFVQVNLVGDNTAHAPWNTDANLVNGWGITFSPEGNVCVSSEGKGMCTNYDYDGKPIGASISIPGAGASGIGHPTGQVNNPTADFKLPNGDPAETIFATSDGTISGWNQGNTAVKKIENPSASYLGIAMMPDGNNWFLYVANFAQNKIDVYDKNWNAVNKPFTDPEIPAGYAPYNITAVSDGKLYVTYAKKNALGKVESGNGFGYINVFSPNGTLLKRFATKGKLNAPWGITKAPAYFWGQGSLISDLILVGNYGDGHISVFDENGNSFGQLSAKGKPIEIDGLLGITFPPANGLNRYYMYFASGPNNGSDGLVGYIKNYYIN
jgi:uncharacterized protein (TIGR03118 family)